MKQTNFHRSIALLLAVSITFSMNSGFVVATAETLPTTAETTEASSETTADGEQEEITAPICTCNPAPGASGVEGHGEECPLYVAPEPPKPEQGECICPPVDSGEVVHGEDCPLYEATKCGCSEDFFEQYGIHSEECPLYTETDLDALPIEIIAEQLDAPSAKTLTLDENGKTVDISGVSPRGRAATPAGANYNADVNAASSVNMNILALAGTPTATMSTVINVPTAPTAGSSTLLSVRFATVGGGKVDIYINDQKLGETSEALPKNQLTVWFPINTSLIKSGENTVRIELVDGSIYFRAARVLLNGGTAFPKITDPFVLQYFEEYADHSGGDMFLRSGFTDFTGMSTFQYTSQEVTTKYKHAIAGNAEINHTVPILDGDGTGCQIFLPDEKGDLIGYSSARYTLKKDDGLIGLNLLEVTHEAAAQTPAKDGKPTYSQITVMGRSTAKGLEVTDCSVQEKNGDVVATTTKVSEGVYTFPWGSNELTEVTFTYTQGGTTSTKIYDFQLNLDIYPPYFSTTVVSVPARATPDTLKGLLLAGVYDCSDDLNPLPFDKALTVDITAVNLNIAGNYTAKITAVDAFGNAKTQDVVVTVVALPVAMGAVTASPAGNDAAPNRTFTSTITEDGGKSFTERGFVVGYSNAPTVEDNVYKLTTTGDNSAFTATKSDFKPNIQYYVRAYGKDSASVVYYSAPLGFSCGAPGDYGALTADDLLLEIPYNGITGSSTVTGNITVTRPSGSTGAVSLNYEILPGSLTTVANASGVLQFAAGVYSQTIPISVTDKEQFNGAKSFTVKLTNPTPTTINGSESASVTVSYTTNYLAVLAPAPTSCLLKGIHTQSRETAGAATTAATAIDFFKVEDGWLCRTPAAQLTRINAPTSGIEYDTYHALDSNLITATVDVSAHAGKIWAAGFITGTYNDTITVTFYSDEAATTQIDTPYTNKVDTAGFVCAVPKDSSVTICTDKNTPGGVGNSTEIIPADAKIAKFQLFLRNSSSTSLGGFFFGVKDKPQLAFTRFDSDIDTTRTYYPGDKLRFYPVLNSAVEPLTAAASIKVNDVATAYDPAQKSFVYTIPVGATTGALTLTHNGAKYTVTGQTADTDNWCNLTPTGSVSSAIVTMTALATVSIMPITSGNTTTHRATVTATGNSGNVEYVWSSSATPPTGGWQTVPAGGAVAGSGYTGSMYLHAKATNATGKTTYAVSSFTFVAVSTFEVSASPAGWVSAATATITTTSSAGANLTVTVNSGTGDTAVIGNTYKIPASGVYTFTATDSFGFSKKLVRSYSIDTLAPVIAVNANGYTTGKDYLKIEGMTATADDGNGSGLASWQYVWSTQASPPSSGWTTVPPSGVIPTQTGTAGAWSLYLKAIDNAGNTASEEVGSFTVSIAAPTLPIVSLTSSGVTSSGATINYTVTKGTNNIAQIITPTETITTDVANGKTDSFVVELNGVYTVAAVDDKGYSAEQSIVVNDIDTDAPTLSAKVYNGASEAVYGTYEKSDSFRVEVTAEDKITPTYSANGQISGYYSSGLAEIKWRKEGGNDATLTLVDGKASFTITANGSYTIAATDTAGNTATHTLRVKSIDNSAPVITPATPPPDGWIPVGSVVGFTVTDADSGLKADTVTVTKGGVPIAISGSYSFTTNGSGTYTITATDMLGNIATKDMVVNKLDAPTFTLTASDTTPTYGDKITLTATIKCSVGGTLPTGNVTFKEGTTTLGVPTALQANADKSLATASYEYTVGSIRPDTFTASYAGDNNYNAKASSNVNVAVSKKDVTLAVSGTKVYHSVPIASTDFVVSNIVGMVNGETDIALLGTLALTSTGNTADAVVGSYDIAIVQSGTSNYNVTTTTITDGFTVTDAVITGITVTPYSGVYDGKAHPYVTISGTQDGDTVQYQLASQSFGTTVPTIKDVGSSAVMVKVTRANHADYAPADWFSAAVNKREVAVDFTVPTNLVYDGNSKTVTATITNKVGADDVSVTLGNASKTAVGEYTTAVNALAGTEAGNYALPNPKPSVTWEITGTPYPHAITLPVASGITYGQRLSDSTLTGNNNGTGSFTWDIVTIAPTAGTYAGTVVFTPTDTSYSPVTRPVNVAVAKKDVTLAVSGTKVYHAAPIASADFVVSNIVGMVNGETDIDLLGTLVLTSTGNTNTATVGGYNITVAQSGTNNYNVTTTTIANGFTVTRAVQTLTGTARYSLLLTDKDFALDAKTDSTDTGAAVTYMLADDGGGAAILTGDKVQIIKTGTATITASAAQTANFEAAPDLTITVNIGSMPSVRVLAAEGITTTEAKIGGVVTAGTVPTAGYGLEYKKLVDTAYTAVSPTETVNGNIKTLTYPLVELEKNTEYAVRIWATTAGKTYESITRFRTAAEQPPTGKVEGEITDNSGETTAITVTIEAGNTVIASQTVTAGGGKFTFTELPDGFYNLVANNGKYKVTRMVEIVKGGAVTDVMMEIGKKQSVVEVIGGDTPNVAVDGLPELFQNDTLYPQADKDMISAGGTVEFKLSVEQTDTSADAEEIGKLAEGKIGAYLDIRVVKTVTDHNGREQESMLMPDLGTNEITIVIPLASELQNKESYTVYRVHSGTVEKLESEYSAVSNTLTIKSSLFSTYAIAYIERASGGSDGNSRDDDNYKFWEKVKDMIENAKDGDTVKAGAGNFDKISESVMDALRENSGVTLEITWNGGDKVIIPAGGALENDGLRIYYPLSYLAGIFSGVVVAIPQKNYTNPETGGVWEVNAPATVAQAPTVITQRDEGTGASPEQVPMDRTANPPPVAPKATTVPNVAEATDSRPQRSGEILFTGITIMFTAAAVACGVVIWEKKHEEEQSNEE